MEGPISSDIGLKTDPYFCDDERLYRRVDPQHLDGVRVLGNAVEDIQEKHPSCSFNRAKYSKPENVLDVRKPEQCRVAFLVAGDLPQPVPHPSDANTLYAFRVMHLPDDGNYSHSEAQVCEQGIASQKLGSKALRRSLREALADKMQALDYPRISESGEIILSP